MVNASNSYTSPGYHTMDVSDISIVEVVLEGAGGGGAGNVRVWGSQECRRTEEMEV